MRPVLAVAAALVGAACSRQVAVETVEARPVTPPAVTTAITGADQLLAAMHERYAGKWYRTLTFIQKSTYLRADGTPSRVETWYEAAALPGRLRIDLGDPSRGNGALYRSDSVYAIQGGRIADRRAALNPLLVLGFDVYAQPPSRTLAQLRSERIDVAVLRTDTLYGRRVYVVGAGPTDSTSSQFWIEAERLLFVRLVQTEPGQRRTQDIRFERYVQHDGGWVAEEVRVLVDGRMVFLEEYENVRVNVPLEDDLFIPEKWNTATHWYKR